MERSQLSNDVNDVAQCITEEFDMIHEADNRTADTSTNNENVVHENDIGDPDKRISKMKHINTQIVLFMS